MILNVKNVTKRFGGLTAVDNVSFGVERGELLGVIGPNGSGKTTLISLISGTLPLSSGEVVYKDKTINKLEPFERARMGIARTFQIVKPLQNLTVEDNIMTAALFGRSTSNLMQEIFGCMSSKPAKEAYVHTEEILEKVSLSQKRGRFARNLTLPERKRLEVARALAMNPEILLLDEVMAGLNLYEVEETMELVKSINSGGVTVIMIEHIMKAIMGISNRVIVLNHGALIANGTPVQVANDDKVIAAYLGSRFASEKKGGDGA